ncbi:hypothetical protein GQ44DRAFT_729646 [Phaeosphaeriaceae sp. PMI808]|nr:hypothetical protein GQ44DRAFT_729646 [Phaeosphaeriaceae sp. PMI808]
MESLSTPHNANLARVARAALSEASPPPSQRSSSTLTWAPSPSPAPARSQPSQLSQRSQSSQPNGAFKWSDESELALIEALTSALNRGLHSDSGYKPEAWVLVMREVSRVSSQVVTRGQCKNKYNSLKKDYRVYTKLIN